MSLLQKKRSKILITLALVVTGCMATGGGGVQLGSRWSGTSAEVFYTSGVAQKYNCVVCHMVGDRGGTVGPILNNIGYRRSEEWIRTWLQDPNAVKNGTPMPLFPFSPTELDAVVGMLANMKLDMQTDAILAQSTSPAAKGEALFKDFDCFACHQIGTEGRTIGPDLSWIGKRKTESWEKNWLRDPSVFKPETFMPNFHLSEPALESLTVYLHTLQGQSNDAARQAAKLAGEFFGYTKIQRGEQIFIRLACASCHGERLRDGVANPNAAPDEAVPAIAARVGDMSRGELQQLIKDGQKASKLDAAGADPLYDCPSYPGALDDEETGFLLTFLKTMAPKKRAWKIR